MCIIIALKWKDFSRGFVIVILAMGIVFTTVLKIAGATPLIDPVLKLWTAEQNKQTKQTIPPEVALTFDLCMGQTDRRIFDVLLEHNIPATLFITKRWLAKKTNIGIIKEIKARPDLFEIANHGANHIPPIDNRAEIYGLKTAGNLQTICAEATGGLAAIKKAGLLSLTSDRNWYRGAAALYSPNALAFLREAGFSIAGFSVNGDFGATLSAKQAYRQIISAKNGDVIIAHMNRPQNNAGAGVAKALLDLQRRGYRFVRLSKVEETETAQYNKGRAKVRQAMSLRAGSGHKANAAIPNCAALLLRETKKQ